MTTHRSLSYKLIFALASLASLIAGPAFARHGEGNTLTNRIPEPAAYEYSETLAGGGQTQNPPFENLWTGLNDVGSCDGCHTGLYDEWNGSMMANAWRDPGWRGAFLLVARLTSTDGCNDIAPTLTGGKAKDNSQGYDCASLGTNTDGSPKLRSINPFATSGTTSAFNMGTPTRAQYSGSGSLMDDFCSRCHMPTNYVDATVNVTPAGQPAFNDPTKTDTLEHGAISPTYDPTAVNPTVAITTSDPVYGAAREAYGERNDGGRPVNSNSGKEGIVCEVCHTNVASRYTPYHMYNKSATDYYAATKSVSRSDPAQRDQFDPNNPLPIDHQDLILTPDPNSQNLGYAIAAGAFRLSPHALAKPERFGPLSWNDFSNVIDLYVSQVFAGSKFPVTGLPTDGKLITTTGPATATSTPIYYSKASPPGKHETYYSQKMERAEFCAACHDVTNPATIKNQFGKWVGGFPIERTYTEFLSSRYADRSSLVGPVGNQVLVKNPNFDPKYKRDCQTCHMQQTFGQPGTALTLYEAKTNPVTGAPITPIGPIDEPSCDRVRHNPGYSHHFVGANAYMTKLIGADVASGTVAPYPELLETSFSSADKTSRLHYARFDTTPSRSGPVATQHERFAWDRLRGALTMNLTAQASVAKLATEAFVALNVVVKNEGAGHNFPTGFPEGRTAWVAVRAFDTKNTASLADDMELQIEDSANVNSVGVKRRSLGVGYLTSEDMVDPNFPGCNWTIPAGSPDPYSLQFRAVATLDGTCPTLDLPYAYAKNLRVNTTTGVPEDAAGLPIDRANPTRLPVYSDTNNNGDLFDDSFLTDTRLQPWKGTGTTSPGATANLSGRYSVVVPSTVVGPVSVTAAVYYQSFEAVVAKKFLGNLANLDDAETGEGFPTGSPLLETCVLKGACDRINDVDGTVIKRNAEVRSALKFDPVVIDGAPPMPVIVKSTAIQVTGAGTTADTIKPIVIINNSKVAGQTNMDNPRIPANRHWSPSPYGGAAGNYAVEGIGEQGVNPGRILKVTFSEPVTGVDANTFYVTTSRGVSVPALMAQIDDTTYALFPYMSAEQTFLSASTNIIHIAPTRNGSTIRDYSPVIAADGKAGNPLTPGPAAGSEYTFGFKIM